MNILTQKERKKENGTEKKKKTTHRVEGKEIKKDVFRMKH